jgi:hypothetical protein
MIITVDSPLYGKNSILIEEVDQEPQPEENLEAEHHTTVEALQNEIHFLLPTIANCYSRTLQLSNTLCTAGKTLLAGAQP